MLCIQVCKVSCNQTFVECGSRQVVQACLKDVPTEVKENYLTTQKLPITSEDINGRCQ